MGNGLPQMLFLRDYRGMNGGHLKVFDYLRHVADSGFFEPVLYLTPESVEPPPDAVPRSIARVKRLADHDAYFVAGLNWRFLDEAGIDTAGKPVVNLIQSVRHAYPDDPRYPYLSRAALRICVSDAVEDALRKSGRADEPIVTNPNATDLAAAASMQMPAKVPGVFIAGLKNPHLGWAVEQALRNKNIETDLCTEHLPRPEFLAKLKRYAIAVVLPHPDEGFFLPALEAMALGAAVVVPAREGIRAFCADGVNSLVVSDEFQSILAAVLRLTSEPHYAKALAAAGKKTAATHTLEAERERFLGELQRYLAGGKNDMS